MDAENFVDSNPILKWFVLPLLLALLCISDFACAAGEPIDLDAEMVFKRVCGNQHWGNTPASFDHPHWVKCDYNGVCNFFGWMSIPIGDEVLEDASTTWFFTKKDNKIQGYNFNKTYPPEVAGEKFGRILKELAKKYGKPTEMSENSKDFNVWLFDRDGAVGFPIKTRSLTVAWVFPKLKCIAKLNFDNITIIEVNK